MTDHQYKAHQKLLRARTLKHLIKLADCRLDEIDTQHERVVAATDRIPVQGGRLDTQGDAMANHVDKRRHWIEERQRAEAEQEQIDLKIKEACGDCEEARAALSLYYVKSLPLRKIADRMHYSQAQANRHRYKGLQLFYNYYLRQG